ncbi:C4-dicarboxylate ABC transporter [Rhodobacterales bacterium 52_120_T64]|nr:C4-dicarboxylate ABC transporter [Rhodobacterales bacterium 52_120_T64]
MNVELGYYSFAFLAALLVLRVPIGVSLIVVSSLGIWYLRGFKSAFGTAKVIPFDFVAHWTLSAVPMFILMGAVASRTGMTSALYGALRLWLGRVPGGLAIATSFAGAGFAAICGSSLATTAAMGRIAVPEMLKQKYDVGLATGAAAAVGTIGALIPPSIIMVIYAVFAEIPVGQMLIAGVIPGIMTSLIYALMIYLRCKFKPSLAPIVDTEPVSLSQKISGLKSVWPILLIAFGITGSIYGGLATATEAGAAGVALTVIIALFQKKLSRKVFTESSIETVQTVASVFLIAIGAALMMRFLALSGMPFHVSGLVTEFTSNPIVVILMCCMLYLILGAFLDPLGILLLTLPILLPIFDDVGMNGIWAGVILIKMLEIGMLTPPMGLNVFVMKSIMGDRVSLVQIFGGISWFLVAEVFIMALLIAFPSFILVLPSLME